MGAGRAGNGSAAASAQRLRGWKEISRHLGVDERTAKRWEASRGLPVHRVPGEPRAPVFAYLHDLEAWERTARDAGSPAPAALPASQRRHGRWALPTLALLVLIAGLAVWLGARALEARRESGRLAADAARLATAQLAALNDQLDSPPGPFAVRAALAQEATRVLDAVAGSQSATPALRLASAEGYRRLAVLQNALDRPSLRNRPAARASLDRALALLEGDSSEAAGLARARVQIEAADQAGGDGDVETARRLLVAARPVALADPAQPMAHAWWLAESVRRGWAGDYAGSAEAARRARLPPSDDVLMTLRRIRALDYEGEGLYYLGRLDEAEARYREALASAHDAAERWPADKRVRWSVLRQTWNVGSTLVEAGRSAEAVAMLRLALAGWQAVAREDPGDEAVLWWVQAARASLGQALAKAGDRNAAIAELSRSVAERRSWHDARPHDADRRRLLLKAEVALAAELIPAGRTGEACAMLGEAQRVARRMEGDAQLTAHDRAETAAPLAAMVAANCAGNTGDR